MIRPDIGLSNEQVVIFLHSDQEDLAVDEELSLYISTIRDKVKPHGSVTVLHVSSLDSRASIKDGTVDICCVGFDVRSSIRRSFESEVMDCYKLLKLGGCVHVLQSGDDESQLKSLLLINGFIDISTQITTGYEQKLCHATAKKPAYELGATVPLSIPVLKSRARDNIENKAWTLALGDDVDEVMDSDLILDESDFKKPDQSTLRVACEEGSGKRKACKNCTCGLAEELKNERDTNKRVTIDNVDPDIKPSSCGNCYLGDAFRCAGCPYLGMPAFKPGERVIIGDNKLQPDL